MKVPRPAWLAMPPFFALALAALPMAHAAADGLPMQSLSLSGNRGPQPTNRAAPGIAPEVGITQKLHESVPLDARFLDEHGSETRLAAYLGTRPLLLLPAYYRCPILCSQVIGGLAGSLKGISLEAGKDFQVVVLSFDPSDTPAMADAEKAKALRRYRRPGSESGWHFLTGSAHEVERVMQAIGYRYSYDAQSHQYAHPAGFLVLTPDGRISRYFLGLDVAPRELRLALIEASAGKIGTPIDRLVLYCYRYDLLAGKYGARILGVLRLGGLLTVAALLGLLLALRWRELREGKRGALATALSAHSARSPLDGEERPAEVRR
jgi:protein SCO1/2